MPMTQVPSSGSETYPAATLGPIAGTTSFATESQGMPIQTSMESSVPLSMVSSDAEHPPIRSQYTYMHSTTAPPQLSIHTTPTGGHEHALSIPRYVDNSRPLKSPRHMNQPSIRGSSSIANTESSPDYRYGSYAPVNTSPSEVAQTPYNAESSGPSSGSGREYYPPPTTWASGGGEQNSSMAYHSHETRPYPFPADQYKNTTAGTSPAKTESSQSQAYSGGPRGSFDTVTQYSWSGN